MKKETVKKASKAIYQQVANKHGLFVWKSIAMLAIIEHLVYKACGDIVDIDDVGDKNDELQSSRLSAVEYLDKTKARFNRSTAATEDMMYDFYFHVEKTMKRKLGAFVNAIKKNCKTIGITQHVDEVCTLVAAMNFMESLIVFYNMTSKLPWYAYIKDNTPIDRGLSLLNFCHKHCGGMLDILDPDMHKAPEMNETINKLYHEILVKWNEGSLYLKAIDYAKKQNKE